MEFLHDLIQRDQEEDALKFAPRGASTNQEMRPLIYHYEAGQFSFKYEEEWGV